MLLLLQVKGYQYGALFNMHNGTRIQKKKPLALFGSMSIYRLLKKSDTDSMQQAWYFFKELNSIKPGLCMVKKEKLTIGKQEYFNVRS